jgi:hypothetical protein
MEPKNEGLISTEGFASVYANHAAVSMSAVDVRVFLSEVSPKQIHAEPTESLAAAEALVQPRVCLVMSPEFARSIMDSLAKLIPQYEERFGPLRPVPTPPKK